MIHGVAVEAYDGDTVVTDMDGNRFFVPADGLQVVWVGAPLTLPDGTTLEAGTGVEQRVHRQHRPEAADLHDWIGHQFETVGDGSGTGATYRQRAAG